MIIGLNISLIISHVVACQYGFFHKLAMNMNYKLKILRSVF